MNAQRHVIKRQLVELTIHGSAEARQFQDELSRIYRQRIIPLIDQYCSELSRPDRLYRIEKLDLNLDELDPNRLEDDFVAKATIALRHELAAQINQQEQIAIQSGSSSRTQSQLDLFAYFVRTGNLPWWADTSHRGLLAENLNHLLDEAPEALGLLLQELADDVHQRQRMISHYSDEQLTELCGLLAPEFKLALQRDFHDLLSGLRNIKIISASSPMRLRQQLWNHFLLVSNLGGQQYATLDAFYQAVLKRTAIELGGTFSALVTDLRQAEQGGRIIVNSHLVEMITRLEKAGAIPELPIPVSEAFPEILAKLQAAGGSFSDVWTVLRELFPRYPSALQTKLLAVLKAMPENSSEKKIAQNVMQVIQTELGQETDQDISTIEPSGMIQMLHTAAEAFAPLHKAQAIVSSARQLPDDRKNIDLNFSEADEQPISNSGLVILWPFLSQFLARLELVENRQFKDEAARHRAVGLLQYLATGDTAFEEYFLPLNKVLCGLGMNEVFDFGLLLTDIEMEECENLLGAVIAQASILRDMSVSGFRGTFLLRPGMLSSRDGAWLLRVEHETYDVVLERFPWNWEWVKLPWMEAPLRVEW